MTDVSCITVKEQEGGSPVPVDPPTLEANSSRRCERERIRLETEVFGPRRVGPLREVDEARFETVEHQEKTCRTEENRNPATRSALHFGAGPAGRTRLRCFIFRASKAPAMIEQGRCGTCHFQGGEAPMPTVTVPTYEDAQLVLKLYELRREEKLRAARDWFGTKFFPQKAEDVTALTGTENAYYRMVTTYWDMAASFVARGILNADLFLDSGGEIIVVWTKLA